MSQTPSGAAVEMFSIESLLQLMQKSVPLLATLVVVIGLLAGINALLKRRWKNQPSAQFRFQMIMLLLTLAGILAIIIALPISNDMQAQILQLIGILLSAAIALSSTTFIGNIMAGIMLKAVKNARPGDCRTQQDADQAQQLTAKRVIDGQRDNDGQYAGKAQRQHD